MIENKVETNSCLSNWQLINFDTSKSIKKNFNFNSIWEIEEFKLQIGQKNVAAYWVIDRVNLQKFLATDWINDFESKFHKIKYCYVFYKNSKITKFDHCHIDIDPDTDAKVLYAVNWCYGPDDANMIWYDNVVTDGEFIEKYNSKYLQFLKAAQPNLLELERKIIGSKLTLLHTAIPHEIEMGSTDRWSISLRLEEMDTIKTWTDALTYFCK